MYSYVKYLRPIGFEIGSSTNVHCLVCSGEVSMEVLPKGALGRAVDSEG